MREIWNARYSLAFITPSAYLSESVVKVAVGQRKFLVQNAIRAVKGLEHLINLSEYFETLEYRYIKTTCY